MLVTVASVAGAAGAAKRSNVSGLWRWGAASIAMCRIQPVKNSVSGSCVEAS